MNALTSNLVPVKARLSALAQLVGLLKIMGVTTNQQIEELTGFSRRAIQLARKEVEGAEGVQLLSWGVQLLSRGGATSFTPGVQLDSSDNPPHGENACAQRSLVQYRLDGTVQTDQTDQLEAACSNISTRAREIAGNPLPLAGHQNLSSAGKPDSQGGTEGPQTPTPSPIVVTTESLIERLAPMLVVDEEADRRGYAEEHIKNLLHCYDEVTINKALTRLKQRLLDGYEVKSFSRMLEALCGDVERDAQAKKPERPVPWGTIDLGNGRFISQWG